MKHPASRARIASALIAALLAYGTVNAADIVYISGNINTAASWTGAALPISPNVAVWDSTSAVNATQSSNVTLSSFKFTDVAGNVTVNIGSSGRTLTLFGDGSVPIIDMSNAAADVSFTTGIVRMGSTVNSTMTVASGRTLSIAQLTTSVSGRTLTFNGGGNVILTGNTGGGTTFAALVNGANVTMNGANTWAGGITVTSGKLTLGNATALGTGAVIVNGGTLESTGTVASTVGANANFSMSGGTWSVSFAGGTSDQLIGSGTGTFSLTGGTLALDGITDYGVTYTLLSGFSSGSVSGLSITGYDSASWTASLANDGVLSFSAVPEPSTFAALAGLACLGVVALRRRRA